MGFSTDGNPHWPARIPQHPRYPPQGPVVGVGTWNLSNKKSSVRWDWKWTRWSQKSLLPYNKQWMPDRTKISDNHGWMGECTGTQSVVCVRPELYLLVLYTDQWEDFSLCSVPTNEMTYLAVYWPMSALVDWFPGQLKPHEWRHC